MSNKKTSLPDEILDAVSGGYLYLGKEKVLSHDITLEGFTVTTESGTYRMEGRPEHYEGRPGAFEKDKANIDDIAASKDNHLNLFPHLFQKV